MARPARFFQKEGSTSAIGGAILETAGMEKLKRGLGSDPEILGGAVVFVGTRVPAQALVDYLQGGRSLEDFLEDFPSVTQEHVATVMEEGK